ncbi:MAG: amidinotransferase [Bacteroidales bacterium]|nr:amidinotransferase [Bacteroidales bacterium]
MSQSTSKVLMVMPCAFGFNSQTAGSNDFQKKGFAEGAQATALREFASFVSLLKANKIEVALAEDTPSPATPDSIFPNNWFSTHEDGTLVIYPMLAPNRRLERKNTVIETIYRNFDVKRVIDLSWWENEGKYLEGTGSMVLDRVNRIAYACLSPRTDREVLEDFCSKLGYTYILFTAKDGKGTDIYHTNVMMSIGTEVAVVCLEAIADEDERARVRESLESTGHKIVEISLKQMAGFAGNMLELTSTDGRRLLILSGSARKALNKSQSQELLRHYRLLSPELDVIENNGGGSARCMLAELFYSQI